MKPALQLKISQSLTMTPQLQQAIRLLQLSNLELQAEIQDALESNMMLEVEEREEENIEDAGGQSATDTKDTIEAELKNDNDEATIPGDLPVDTTWEDIYDNSINYGIPASTGPANFIDSHEASGKSLADHLHWQLNLIPVCEKDKAIAIAIIDNLDNDGYLTTPLEEILPLLGNESGIDEIEAMLRLIQSMEPAGIAARNLRECLDLQLAQLDDMTPWIKEAKRLVNNHLDLLAAHDFTRLMKKMKLDQDQLAGTISLIQSLNPRPGRQIQDEAIQYIIPDVYAKRDNERWLVELNNESTPGLKINTGYANMIRRADNSSDNNSLRVHLQEAKWFIKSLQSRNETLLKVATTIVERQQAFLEHGEQAMQPMVLHDIAQALGMHESTISRVTTKKYMHTPRGIFELKYFFSSHVNTDDGGATSSTAIRAHIKKLLSEENARKPYSDSEISRILNDRGINVARRTVAKYREAMAVPPSSERKRLI